MAKVLLVDPDKTAQSTIDKTLYEHKLTMAADADIAVTIASENIPDLVILELSLKDHSGLEFLYEFRTYSDWMSIPVLIYSSVKLTDTVLKSRVWSKLNVAEYLYKPESSLSTLKMAAEKALS